MGASHSNRQVSASRPAVILAQLNDEPRRVGCASFLRSETFSSRRGVIHEEAWKIPAKAELSTHQSHQMLETEDRKIDQSTGNKANRKRFVRVKAGLKTVLAHHKHMRPSSVAPDVDIRAASKSLSSLSTVAETATDNKTREPCVRPHSVAGERRVPSGSFPYRQVESAGSLQYSVRHSEAPPAGGQSHCSSAVSCSSLVSAESSSRAASRSSCSGSCSSLARTTRSRALTSSTSSQTDSGVFSMVSSRRSSSSSSSGASSRCMSRCSADRTVNSPSPLCRSSRSPRISELLTAFARVVSQQCPVARREEIESWVKAVDRALLHSGWQEQPFLCTANAVLVFAVFQRASFTEHIRTAADLRGVILTCLYVAYSYGGHEISYPLKPFLYTSDRELFWERCMRIACSSSDIMLQVNLQPQCYQDLLCELLEFLYN